MINKDNQAFEDMLVEKYKINKDPELSEVLIKEYSSHKIKSTSPSIALDLWIGERSIQTKNRTISMLLKYLD